MQSFTLSFIMLSLIGSINAFAPNSLKQTTLSKTALNFDIIMPPDEDNCEIDNSNCEESVFAQKRAEKAAEKERLRDQYVANGLKLTDIDRMETVDQYSNISGGIIPGVHLTALMEDD